MKVFEGFNIKDMELRNRIVMPPMCMYSSDDTGIVKEFHRMHYGARAYGGTALVIQEATAVEPRGRISDKDLGIWSDEHIERKESSIARFSRESRGAVGFLHCYV